MKWLKQFKCIQINGYKVKNCIKRNVVFLSKLKWDKLSLLGELYHGVKCKWDDG